MHMIHLVPEGQRASFELPPHGDEYLVHAYQGDDLAETWRAR